MLGFRQKRNSTIQDLKLKKMSILSLYITNRFLKHKIVEELLIKGWLIFHTSTRELITNQSRKQK